MEVCVLSATMRGVRVEFRLPRDAMCSLGRSSSCTLQVKDPRISRQHCLLYFDGEVLAVTDMGSANELQHIGERKSSLRLMSGDSFHAGNTYFRFEAIERTPGDASSVAEPAAPPAESPAEPAAEPPAELPAEPTTWPGEPAIGDVVAGCRLLKLLGRSERCAVFAAEHLTLHRRIALKWLGPHASREQFLADIRKTTSLDLPGLVGVFDVAPDPANCCAWMELVEGASIAVRIAEGPRFLWHEAADLAIASLLVADQLHRLGHAHCGIKPSNVFLLADGQVKLADLRDAERPRPGEDCAFFAPEFVERGLASAHGDIYSIAATSLAAMAGGPAEDLMRCVAAVRAGGAPRAFADWLVACLSPSPLDRPASAAAALAWLQELRAPTSATARAGASLAPAAVRAATAPAPTKPRPKAASSRTVGGPRRLAARGPKAFLARLTGEFIVFSIILATGIAILLLLKIKWPDFDIYRLVDFKNSR